MRRIAKIDGNQHEVVDAFRKLGFSVLLLHQVGGGCPDILVGKYKRNVLVEIKDDSKPPSARKLTNDQRWFHESWHGEIYIVNNVADVFKLSYKLMQEGSWDKNS